MFVSMFPLPRTTEERLMDLEDRLAAAEARIEALEAKERTSPIFLVDAQAELSAAEWRAIQSLKIPEELLMIPKVRLK